MISNPIDISFETYRHIYQNGKNATKTNIVLKNAEVLRPRKAHTVNEIENRLNEWKEKQRYLLISSVPVNMTEHLLKSAAVRSDDEGSYEELEKGLLEYLAMIEQQHRKALGNSEPRGRQGGSHRPPRRANVRVHKALVR